MMNQPLPLTGLSLPELEAEVISRGHAAFRARQIWRWVYKAQVVSFEEMSDIPNEIRQWLGQEFSLSTLTSLSQRTSSDGRTTKVLFQLRDGGSVEAVSMLHTPERGRKARHTICLSSQLGCPIGCPFCATGKQGFDRNLTAGEIVEQALHLARKAKTGTATNLVFMGMGEPLLNYDAVLKAVRILNSSQGWGIGARHITISTAGLLPQIKRLSREGLQVGLAVSLHAPDDKLRDELVPINRRYPVEELIAACRDYFAATGRLVTFEYALFASVNDSVEQARRLAGIVEGMPCHVNLILANRTGAPRFRPSSMKSVLAFQDELNRHGVANTLRESLGEDIEAGCGQLRSRYVNVL